MVAGAVAAVAAIQQARSVEQALVKGGAASKARCGRARQLLLLLLLLLEAQLVLTRQGSVQAARRQVHALTAARGGGRRERIPQSAAARRPEVAAVAAGRHAGRAGRHGLATAAVRLGQLLLSGGVQVACWQRQGTQSLSDRTNANRLELARGHAVPHDTVHSAIRL